MAYKFSSIISIELRLTSTVFRGIKCLCELFSWGKNNTKWQVRIFGLEEETNQGRKHRLVYIFMTIQQAVLLQYSRGFIPTSFSTALLFYNDFLQPFVISTFSVCSSRKDRLHDARVFFCFQREAVFTVSPSTLSSSKGLCWVAVQ